MSARRIIRDCPNLFFSHLRTAMRYKELGIAQIELAAASDLGLSVDKFRVVVAEHLGKPTPPAPIFDEIGGWMDLLNMLALKLGAQQLPGFKVRIIVRPEN